MKKILLSLCIAVSFTSAKAQISLEHYYPTTSGISLVHIEGDGEKYIGTDTTTKNMLLFNTDHSLWKTIPSAISGTNVYYYGFASKYLFNSDVKIEFLMGYYNTAGTVRGVKIINEDGTLVMDFPNANSGYAVSVSVAWKLIIGNYYTSPYGSNSSVYSLPGTYAGLPIVSGGHDASAKLFPNPVSVSATLKYKLPESDHTGKLSIFNSAGSLVKQMTISDMFDNVTINRDELPAGVYIYNVTTASGAVLSSKFEVN